MQIVANIEDIDKLRNLIHQSIELASLKVRERQYSVGSVETMFELRFDRLGYDPISHTPLNFVEQLNQVFSDLVVLEGARYLLNNYPGMKFQLHLGSEPGFDIESVDGKVFAECFAVTTVKSNDKLARDAKKLMKLGDDRKKYIFLYTQNDCESYLRKRYSAFPDISYIRIARLF